MDTYSILRHLADSWGLVVMSLLLLGVFAWAFRPGSSRVQDEAAHQIFRNEDAPKKDDRDGH